MAKRGPGAGVSTLQLFAMLVFVLIAVVGLVIVIAPDKATAPPPSVISYEERPETHERQAPSYASRQRRTRPEPSRTEAPEPAEAQPAALDEPNPAKPYRLLVKVVDAATKQPLAKARAVANRRLTPEEETALNQEMEEVRQAQDGGAMTAFLDRERELRENASDYASNTRTLVLHLTSPGEYKLRVSAPGHLPAEEIVPVDERQPRKSLIIALSAGASISGRVVEEGGRGVSGITVQVSGPVGEVEQTDQDGDYTISGLTPGDYEVFAMIADLAQDEVLDRQSVKIVNETQQVRNVNFTIPQLGTVWGYALTTDDEPVRADLVLVTSDSIVSQVMGAAMRGRIPRVTQADSETGYYEISGVRLDQEWRVYAQHSEYPPQLTDPFMLTKGRREVRVDVLMHGGSDCYGIVVDSQNRPVEGAEVMCLPAFSGLFSRLDSAPTVRQDRTDDEGRFELAAIPSGRYQLFAMAEGYKLMTQGVPIFPTGYSDVENVRIVLDRVDEGEHDIYGVVMASNGRPISGAECALAGLSVQNMSVTGRETTTDATGAFLFDGVDAGTYQLHVRAEGYAPRMIQRVLIDKENEIFLSQSARVEGRVLLEGSREPVAGAQIRALPARAGDSLSFSMGDVAAEQSSTVSGSDGAFTINVSAGTHIIEARQSGYTPARQMVTVEAGAYERGLELLLSESGGEISGRIIARGGDGPQGTRVILVESGAMQSTFAALAESAENVTVVGESGEYAFEQLPPGEYMVMAMHPEYAGARSDLLVLEQGQRLTGIDLRLGQGGALEGYVYEGGRPLAGATVLVMAEGKPDTATTDEEGYYYIDELSSGTVQVVLMPSGAQPDIMQLFNTRGATVEIVEGQTTRHDFGTGGGVTLAGRVMPPPPSMLGGRAVLRPLGPPPMAVGSTASIDQLFGSSTGIDPQGMFTLEDVAPGQWSIDIFYIELGTSLNVRFVHTEAIEVTGEQETVPVDIQVAGY